MRSCDNWVKINPSQGSLIRSKMMWTIIAYCIIQFKPPLWHSQRTEHCMAIWQYQYSGVRPARRGRGTVRAMAGSSPRSSPGAATSTPPSAWAGSRPRISVRWSTAISLQVRATTLCYLQHQLSDDSAGQLRAYLAGITAKGAVWIGLHQAKPQTQFTWT